MIKFNRKILSNGLRVLVHEDPTTSLAAVNVLYNVGSKHERSNKTGMVHLFEHLMFEGSQNIPNFDDPLQAAGGESNAFTNKDLTNYYEKLPAMNIETALWLESDRMLQLDLEQEKVDIQRKVVIEEFRETCIEKPFGTVWHELGQMVYGSHPYRWPAIGQEIEHIAQAELKDLQFFYDQYYHPSNSILTVTGGVKTEQVYDLVEKWFGDIPAGKANDQKRLPVKLVGKFQEKNLEAKSGTDAIYLGFLMPERGHPDYYTVDFITDILATGSSARLEHRLKIEQELFSYIDAYITGEIDEGMVVVEAKLQEGVTHEMAQEAIWVELNKVIHEPLSDEEHNKLLNKVESSVVFGRTSQLNISYNLAFYELIGNAAEINEEMLHYRAISKEKVMRVAANLFRKENCSQLNYFQK